MRALAPAAVQDELLGLAFPLDRLCRQRPADLLAVHRDGELRVALVWILAHAERKRIRAGSG